MELPPFQSLIDAHGLELHRFLVATLGPDRADDCYQETWIAALDAYPRLQDAGNLRAWLFTIARRKAIDAQRAGRRGAALEARIAASARPVPSTAVAATLAYDLWPSVAALPPKQRRALGLRYLLDADYATIAHAMDTSQDAARRNVYEGLEHLRKEYGRDRPD